MSNVQVKTDKQTALGKSACTQQISLMISHYGYREQGEENGGDEMYYLYELGEYGVSCRAKYKTDNDGPRHRTHCCTVLQPTY